MSEPTESELLASLTQQIEQSGVRFYEFTTKQLAKSAGISYKRAWILLTAKLEAGDIERRFVTERGHELSAWGSSKEREAWEKENPV